MMEGEGEMGYGVPFLTERGSGIKIRLSMPRCQGKETPEGSEINILIKSLEELSAQFLYQAKQECLFLNGTQWLQFLYRLFYNRQEYVRFNSDIGTFVAITELGQVSADTWNRDKEICRR
ncbi:putative MHC class II antigen protein [Naja naja]|nr:putative MHC class II antigen protein [Naja naja]